MSVQTPAKRQASPTSPASEKIKRGLMNLGNTCFMNSSLQCLVHTIDLSTYFLTDRFRQDINTTNPLGQQGEISIRYADVVKQLWAEINQGFAPRLFKQTIGRMNHTFEGYGQQDSHELLQTLLDGLHEDLNRIPIKKYQEDPEMGDLTEQEFAKICWESYLKRNDSIIVDLFQGQLKSRTVCQVCQNVSIKFDPYMYLQLPIPEPKTSTVAVTTLGKSSRNMRFVNHKFNVPRHASIEQVKEIAAKELGWDGPTVCVELFNHKVYKALAFETVSSIAPADVIAIYECENLDTRSHDKPHYISARFTSGGGSYSVGDFGNPIFVPVPEEVDINSSEKIHQLGLDCYSLLVAAVARFSKWPLYRRIGTSILMKSLAVHFNPSNNDISRPEMNVTEDDFSEVLKDGFEPIPDLFEVMLSEEHGYSRDQKRIYPPETDTFSSNLQPNAAIEMTSVVPSLNYGWQSNDPPPPYTETPTPILAPKTYHFQKDSNFVMVWDKITADFVFGASGQIESYKSATYQCFEPSNDSSMAMEQIKEEKNVTLENCMNEFTKEEILTGTDSMYCSNCKAHQETQKKLSVYTVPQILVIHLKRFSSGGSFRSKLDAFVSAPIDGLVILDVVYDLYAVSNHYGGLGGGHYTAYVRDPIDGNWYDADDSRVTLIKNAEIITEAAYVLFYKKRDADKAGNFEDILEEAREKFKTETEKESVTRENISIWDSTQTQSMVGNWDNPHTAPLTQNLVGPVETGIAEEDPVMPDDAVSFKSFATEIEDTETKEFINEWPNQ